MIGYQEETYALKRGDEKQELELASHPPDYVQVLLNVSLASFSFKYVAMLPYLFTTHVRLVDYNDKTTVLDIVSKNADLTVKLYPKAQSLRVSVRSFEVCEYSTLAGETLRILTTNHENKNYTV